MYAWLNTSAVQDSITSVAMEMVLTTSGTNDLISWTLFPAIDAWYVIVDSKLPNQEKGLTEEVPALCKPKNSIRYACVCLVVASFSFDLVAG